MKVRAIHRARAVLLGLVVLLPLALAAGSAQAATHVVTLTEDGPAPASVTIPRGDTVTFRNTDDVPHRVRSTGGPWGYDVTIAAGSSTTTPRFTVVTTFRYQDSYRVALLTRTADGSITVTAPKPTPTRSATPAPSGSATPAPTATGGATPTATPSPSGSVTAPPIGLVTIPPVTPSSGPTPDIAPPTTTTESGTPVAVAYGDPASLVQSSPHRYGLPMALALVAALGALSLILRLLLTGPPPVVPGDRPEPAERRHW